MTLVREAKLASRATLSEWGRDVVLRESRALDNLAHQIGESFAETVEILHATMERGGRILLTGSGKSGLVARKIAATFCSTAAPAIFLHPADAAHGDLGLVTAGDALIVVSRSGSIEGLETVLAAAERLGVPILAWTCDGESQLSKHASVLIPLEVGPEADPDDLIPSCSSAAAMALGDAAAIALFRGRGLTARDFAALHPGGQLGRRLTMCVRDLMSGGDQLPIVQPSVTLFDAMHVISDKRLGVAIVLAADGRIAGILTDGDIRRALLADPQSLHRPVQEVMTRDPRTINPDELVERAIQTMETPSRRITSLVVVDADRRPVGVLHLHSCLEAGFR
jgi:arabinose-5-phosphate isomerase